MDNLLILWNTVSGEMLRKFYGHDDMVYRCRLFRNASAMLSCSSDKTLKSWFLTPQVCRRARSVGWRRERT